MPLQLVRLVVHLILEDAELLLQTLLVLAQPVILPEVPLEHVVVAVVLPPLVLVSAGLADEALLVPVAHVGEEFIVRVEPLTIVLAQTMFSLFMCGERLLGVKRVLVGKDLFVGDAELAYHSSVFPADMGSEILPARAGDLAVGIGTVEAQEQDGLFQRFFGLEADGELLVGVGDVGGLEVGEGFGGMGGKDEVVDVGFAKGTFVLFVENTETECADVTGSMVARSDGGQFDGVCADEAELGFGW